MVRSCETLSYQISFGINLNFLTGYGDKIEQAWNLKSDFLFQFGGIIAGYVSLMVKSGYIYSLWVPIYLTIETCLIWIFHGLFWKIKWKCLTFWKVNHKYWVCLLLLIEWREGMVWKIIMPAVHGGTLVSARQTNAHKAL